MSDTAGTGEPLSAEERIRRRDALHPDDPMFRHNRASPGDDYHAAISDRHELLATLERDRAASLNRKELAEKVAALAPETVRKDYRVPDPKWDDLVTRAAVLRLIEGSDPASPDRSHRDWRQPPRYQWTETGMVLDSKGAYVLAHMVPSDPARPLCDFDGCGLPVDHPGDHGGWWADPASPEPRELDDLVEPPDPAIWKDHPPTHGRHCPCYACKVAQDWTEPNLAPCGIREPHECPPGWSPWKPTAATPVAGSTIPDRPLDVERALRLVFTEYAIVPDRERIDGPHVVIVGNAVEAAQVLAPKVAACLAEAPGERGDA